jgi:hypothetical protein
MRTKMIAGFGLVLAVACTAPAAFAQGPACKAEIAKVCKDVKAGGGRIISCLRKNDASLSDACRAYVNTASQYMACLDDAAQLCPGMEPASGRVLECLRANESDLSMECEAELQKLRR